MSDCRFGVSPVNYSDPDPGTPFFYDFIHVYSPGAEADNPLGMKFDVNRNILSLRSFVASFKKIPLKSDFIQFFSCI